MTKKGSYGELISTIPPLSAPAWSSIITGLNPGKHGVYDFVAEVSKKGIPEVMVHNSKSLRGKTVWDILSRHKKKVIVVNVPLTYPPYPVNGIIISGFPAPVNRLTAYPLEIEKELRKKHPNYKIDIDYLKPNYRGLDEKRFLSEAYRLLQSRYEVVKDLLENYEWDLFFVAFMCPDRIQHVFWGYMNEAQPTWRNEKARKFREIIPQLYMKLDEIVDSLLKCVSEDTIIFVISDHGFDFAYKYFGLNNWLVEIGLLRKSKPRVHHYSLAKSLYIRLAQMGLLDMNSMFNLIPRRVKNLILPSEARAPFFGGIRLSDLSYDAGRGEYLKQYITKELVNLRDETNHPIVEKVFYREEIYWGERLSDAPDIIVILKRGYKPVRWTSGFVIESIFKSESEGSVESGIHSSLEARKGIIFVSGKSVVNRKIRVDAVDIAPTILWILGIPVPKSMDGNVLNEIFCAGG
jgi:predicted AlkP superfamily phosphohydrolase/phosphomutase